MKQLASGRPDIAGFLSLTCSFSCPCSITAEKSQSFWGKSKTRSRSRNLHGQTLASGLLLFLCLICTACREQIIHNLSEKEANQLLTSLHEIKIRSEKTRQADGKWALAVPGSQALRAIKYLNDSRMLRDIGTVVPPKSSMISSREDREFRLKRLLSREIEHTLGCIDGILEARVHLNLPQRDPFLGRLLEKDYQGSASVLLIAGEELSINKDEIRSLVSGAAGVKEEGVAVLFSRTAAEQAPAVLKPLLPAVQTFGLGQGVPTQIAVSCVILGTGAAYSVLLVRRRKARKLEKIARLFRKSAGDKGADDD